MKPQEITNLWAKTDASVWFKDGQRTNPPPPKLTVINYSGGKQSSMIVWMVLKGLIPKPDNLIILNANPGMENENTYKYNDIIKEACARENVPCITVPGPNLYEDILKYCDPASGVTRMANPPYWVDKGPGQKMGRLPQKCTAIYKIFPMDRYIRKHLETTLEISSRSTRIGEGIVEKWIGFSYNEVHRIKPPSRKYIRFRYPLVDLKLTNQDIANMYIDLGLPIPPRSVCNACFANGLDTLKEMYLNRPDDWKQAVAVDKAVRDMKHMNIKYPAYVSSSLIPLEDLPSRNFGKGKKDLEEYSCDSGYCFT